jgi:hypothetical protein
MASGGMDPVAQALATATSTQVGALGQETATVLLEEGWGMSSPDGTRRSRWTSPCSASLGLSRRIRNVRFAR